VAGYVRVKKRETEKNESGKFHFYKKALRQILEMDRYDWAMMCA
jgi:hypothetical protein